jgi:hypothetical protein
MSRFALQVPVAAAAESSPAAKSERRLIDRRRWPFYSELWLSTIWRLATMNVSSNAVSGEVTPGLSAVSVGSSSELAQVRTLTESMFAGQVDIETDFDPEDPAAPWWNLRVKCLLDPHETSALLERWYEAVYQIGVSDATRFRVLVCRP